MLNLNNHWIPVGIGDWWSAQCLSTREFVAIGKAHTKPLLFKTASQALLACENAERGDYDNAPPRDVWRVISNGVDTRADRNEVLKAAKEKYRAIMGLAEVCETVRQESALSKLLREKLEPPVTMPSSYKPHAWWEDPDMQGIYHRIK